jgi:predicted TIM-barrel fold metal-dependent hydrolase
VIEMETTPLYQDLLQEIHQIPLVDTHEHLIPEQEHLKRKRDFFSLFLQHYASSDLISAGMDANTLEQLRVSDDPTEEKWKRIAPFWKKMQNTSFACVLKIATKDLFDIEEINETTIADLSKQIEIKNISGWYDYVLKERTLIDKIFVRSTLENIELYSEYFLPIVSTDLFLDIRSSPQITQIEKLSGIEIHSLKNLLDAMEKFYHEVKQKGAIGIKISQAYKRTLKYEKWTFADAENVFNKILSGSGLIPNWDHDAGLGWIEGKPLTDFLVHNLVRLAGEIGLVVQIHTGFQEGQGNYITNSNPTLLANLCLEYTKTTFDIFHAGFPYHLELACMAKNFPNVFADMCWLHAIGVSTGRQTLYTWLDIIPINKIFAFGGDYHFVEGVYAHAKLARQNVAWVLAKKIQEEVYTKRQASIFGKKLLKENAECAYKVI